MQGTSTVTGTLTGLTTEWLSGANSPQLSCTHQHAGIRHVHYNVVHHHHVHQRDKFRRNPLRIFWVIYRQKKQYYTTILSAIICLQSCARDVPVCTNDTHCCSVCGFSSVRYSSWMAMMYVELIMMYRRSQTCPHTTCTTNKHAVTLNVLRDNQQYHWSIMLTASSWKRLRRLLIAIWFLLDCKVCTCTVSTLRSCNNDGSDLGPCNPASGWAAL